jgi:hypothetical protein
VKYTWIYDTPALVGYVAGTSPRVRAGLRLIAEDPGFRLTVPAVCLIEAYADTPAERHWRLDSLAINPGVTVMGVDAADTTRVGALCAITGRAGAAHAAFAASTRAGIVFTDAPMPGGVDVRPI